MQEDHPERFTIIDGQQRIATLSIIILVIIGRLKELAVAGVESDNNRERAAVLRCSFIGAKQAGALLETSKLTLNRNDGDFFQGTLVQLDKSASERSLSDSEKQLWGCFKYFRRRIGEEFQDWDGQQLADWVESRVFGASAVYPSRRGERCRCLHGL